MFQSMFCRYLITKEQVTKEQENFSYSLPENTGLYINLKENAINMPVCKLLFFLKTLNKQLSIVQLYYNLLNYHLSDSIRKNL